MNSNVFQAPTMKHHTELLTALDAMLEPSRFKDYGPNGLQVEGKNSIRTLVSGVTLVNLTVFPPAGPEFQLPSAPLKTPFPPATTMAAPAVPL
jgi:hypothetical protein